MKFIISYQFKWILWTPDKHRERETMVPQENLSTQCEKPKTYLMTKMYENQHCTRDAVRGAISITSSIGSHRIAKKLLPQCDEM